MRMRKLMLPRFQGEAIAHYSEVIAEITTRERRLASRRHDPHAHVAQTIPLEVIIQAVFGISDPQRTGPLPAAAAEL